MTTQSDEYDVACRALRKHDIHESLVDFCPINMSAKGLMFRIRREIGAVAQWVNVPIVLAQREPQGLIGFIFPDGSMRNDAEITCKHISTSFAVNLPIYVCFWKIGVPLQERNYVADRKKRSEQRPTIVVLK